MGCISSKHADKDFDYSSGDGRPDGKMREEFWDTQPHYGGDKVIWDALKAACESDMATAKLIIDTAGIIVAAKDMTICYDERGAKYELPPYVLSDPENLAAS